MKKLALSTVTLLTALTLAGCSSSDTVATSAGDQKVTKQEFYDAMKDEVGGATLQRMVLINVLENEAGKNDFAKEAETEMRTSMASAGGEQAFLGFLNQMGFGSIREYQDQLLINKLIPEVMKKRAGFTDEDYQKYYDESYEPEIHAAHILVDDEEKAKDLIKQLNDGADFAELAKENSSDGSAQNGGDLGFFGRGKMVPEFEEAAYALKENEITQTPVQSSHGYHIIKMLEKPEKGTFEEERENVESDMVEEKMNDSEFFSQTIREVMKDAKIKINDDDLKDIMKPYLEDPAEAESATETGDPAATDSAETDSATSDSSDSEAASSESAE